MSKKRNWLSQNVRSGAGPRVLATPLLALTAAVAVAVLPASASAEVRTASFDELGDNVPIAEQYAAQGIHFNLTAPFPINSKVCTRSFYALATARAFNPPNVAHANRCGIEFGYSGVLVKVDRSRMVSAEAGLSVAAGSTGPVKLEAYNETGGVVGLAEGTAGPSASTTLRVERPGGDIYWAAFYSDNANTPLELDFFQTDAVVNTEPPPPPPQPDFQIEADSPNSLGLAPGGIATTYLTIRRLAGSTGRIGFSAENLPRGVTASFLPDPAAGGDRERVRVTFTAAADAPAVSDGIVFIRARPLDATAGADVRSATAFLSVAGRVDLRLRGIDVFQAVQGLGTLLPGPATNGGEYRGTRLGAGQKTVARVFADATGAAPPGVNASVVLRGYDAAGRERPDSPLFPIWAPNGIAQRETPGVFPDERADPGAAYTFVLPPTWTHGKLNLRAGISVPGVPPLRRPGARRRMRPPRLRREQQLRPARHRVRTHARVLDPARRHRARRRPAARPAVSRLRCHPGGDAGAAADPERLRRHARQQSDPLCGARKEPRPEMRGRAGERRPEGR